MQARNSGATPAIPHSRADTSPTWSTSPATGSRPPRWRERDRRPRESRRGGGDGQSDPDTGQAICAFVTLNGGVEPSDEVLEGIREGVAAHIGKFARPKRVIWADDLPKTRSGKIMRRLLRDIAEGRALGDVTTLRDPGVMAELEKQIAAEGDED